MALIGTVTSEPFTMQMRVPNGIGSGVGSGVEDGDGLGAAVADGDATPAAAREGELASVVPALQAESAMPVTATRVTSAARRFVRGVRILIPRVSSTG